MQTQRRLLFCLLFLAFSFSALSVSIFAQQVIATVPVGSRPYTEAINPATNQIYVANGCGNDFSVPCMYPYSQGTVTIIDGPTNNASSVNVGYLPYGVAVNATTNKIYVANQCGSDSSCGSDGTVTVIDGVTLNTITIPVESDPYAVAVNPVTNRIYVVNGCGSDPTCATYAGTVSVIDGVSNTVIATVPVGASPEAPVVNATANQIYVPNSCGNDPTCAYPYVGTGTVTLIDGATNNPSTVPVGVYPYTLDANTATNKIYVANQCGDDPNCAGSATVTVIDGSSLATTEISTGGLAYGVAVNSVTNKIYVSTDCFGDPLCGAFPLGAVTEIDGSNLSTKNAGVGNAPYYLGLDSGLNKVYVANYCGGGSCSSHYSGTVTVIDTANPSLPTANVSVGTHPYDVAVNSATHRVYIPNICGNDSTCQTRHGTVSVIDGTPPTALRFVPLAQPCRAVDTRLQDGGGGPIQGGTFQSFPIQQEGACNIPATAAAYSLNVTLIPPGQPVGFLTIWPTGELQPVVSTMNSFDGRFKANAAIVPAGTGGAVSVYASDTTDVALDVNGYFEPGTGSELAFYPLAPCRVADTRNPDGDLGGPYLHANQQRTLPVLESTCGIPATAQAYSFNFTAIPRSGPLYVFTAWPAGQPQPNTSTLNAPTGTVVANAGIVSAGPGGAINVWASNDSDLAIDVDGYFAPVDTGGLSLYGVRPCRILDTRNVGSGLPFNGMLSPPVNVVAAGCAASSLAQAFVFNATIVPQGAPVYVLTLWPDGGPQPNASTLNSYDTAVTSNMAIVPTTNGSIDADAAGLTQLILDISSYFAP